MVNHGGATFFYPPGSCRCSPCAPGAECMRLQGTFDHCWCVHSFYRNVRTDVSPLELFCDNSSFVDAGSWIKFVAPTLTSTSNVSSTVSSTATTASMFTSTAASNLLSSTTSDSSLMCPPSVPCAVPVMETIVCLLILLLFLLSISKGLRSDVAKLMRCLSSWICCGCRRRAGYDVVNALPVGATVEMVRLGPAEVGPRPLIRPPV